MTVEVSGTGKLWNAGPLKNGGTRVALTLPYEVAEFYNLKPGMFCKFTLIFPDKQDINDVIEPDEAKAAIDRQKIDRFAEHALRKWYNDMKAVYDRGKIDPKFKVPDYIKRMFDEPDGIEKLLSRTQ